MPESPEAHRRGRWRGLGRRFIILSVFASLAGAFVLLLLVGLIDNRMHRGETLRHVDVGGVDVGGQSDAELRSTLTRLEPRLEQLSVELVGNDRAVTASARAAGLTIDIDATTAAALRAGRGRLAPLRWVIGLVHHRASPLVLKVDENTVRESLAPFGTPRDDTVTFTVKAGAIVVNEGHDGIVGDASAVGMELLASARRGDSPIRAHVDTTTVAPTLSADARAALADTANRASVNGLTLKLGDTVKNLDAATLRSWMSASQDGHDYVVDANTASAAIASLFAGAGGPGRDAKLGVFAGQTFIAEGEPATTCCTPDAAARVTTALHAGSPAVDLAFVEAPRPKGREWAATLGVKELIGEFTTRYAPGQPRVTNIKRIAELTQGALIEPGKTFSINEFVGKRTIEKGFVSGGVIQDGVFQEDIGGGISQYATTIFNAAFFSGLDFADYQSHSIYIGRYPYGREATVSYPAPDLKITNSTPYAVLIWPTATDTSLTVQMWSTKYATGAQTAQSEKPFGAACTRVVTERTRTYADGRPNKVDSVVALYQKEGIDCSGNPTPGATTTTTTSMPPTTTTPPTTTAPTPTTTAHP